MKPIVSVIVPVYNGEQFIERCVDSILKQKFDNFELILVNDGSSDNSGEICGAYAIRDSRIRVIHQQNMGAGAARNTGIRIAEGEYLAFCDCDDVVSDMWLERLYEFADTETLPMGAYCSRMNDLGQRLDLEMAAGKKMARAEYYSYNQIGIAGYLANALYCRDIVVQNNLWIRGHRENGDYNEDLCFALSYVSHIKNIVYTGYADYLYDVRDNSLSHSYQQYYFDKYEEKYRLWYDFICKNNTEPEELLKDLSTRHLFHFLTALKQEADQMQYARFRKIILSESVQTCLRLADVSKENPFIIKKIQNKRVFTMWIFYLLLKIKRR